MRMHQMLHCSDVSATSFQCHLDCFTYMLTTELPGQLQEIDHVLGAGLLTGSSHEGLPDLIEALRPKTRASLLFKRPRTRQRARFTGKRIEIMFQIEHLLLAALASFMTGNTVAVMPKLHDTGVHFRLHLRSRFQRHRVGVRQHLDTPEAVHGWKGYVGQIDTFCC